MKKRALVAILAMTMLMGSLAGCGSGGGSSTTSTEGSSSTPTSTESSGEASAEGSEAADAGDAAAEAVANRTETQTVVVSWMNYTGAPNGMDRIVAAMDELTIPELNLKVDMQVTDAATRSQQLTLQISGGEQLDIVQALGISYGVGVTNGYWYDMESPDENGNNLLTTYGSGIIDTLGQDTIDACRAPDGTLYGVTQQKENAQGRFALSIGTQYLENAAGSLGDLTPDLESDVWRVDGIEDLATILKAVHDANPGIDTFAPGGLQAGWTSVDSMGDYFGVLGNWGTGDIVSYFEDESYLTMVNTMRDLFNYGCISANELTDTTSASTRVQAGSLMSYITNYKPGSKIQESTLCGQDMTIVLGGPDFTVSNSIAGMPWCICANTADPVAAMQYMNFMYTSPEWNELFKWGQEGVDFEEVDGTARFLENAEYNHAVQWMAPGQFLAMPEYGNPTDLWDQYEIFNDEAIKSEAIGFMFDQTPVATEYTALTNVYTQYQKSIEYGAVDPTSSLEEMKAALDAAGYQKYLDEKQAQYTAWKDANGNA